MKGFYHTQVAGGPHYRRPNKLMSDYYTNLVYAATSSEFINYLYVEFANSASPITYPTIPDGDSADALDYFASLSVHANRDYLILPVISTRLLTDAVKLFAGMGEKYKVEIIESIPAEQGLSFYRQGDFIDLCRGPHVPSGIL